MRCDTHLLVLLPFLVLFTLCFACEGDGDEADDDNHADDDTIDDDTVDDDTAEDDDTSFELYAMTSDVCNDQYPYYCWDIFRCRTKRCRVMESQSDQVGLAWAIWVSENSEIFLVGDDGLIWEFDGVSWQEHVDITDAFLDDVWGTSANDVFAVGSLRGYDPPVDHPGHIIMHYDGDFWTEMKRGPDKELSAVWGTSHDSVYAVGDGLILHYDGTKWQRMEADENWTLYTVWGTSDQDVFAGGCDEDEKAIIIHYDGVFWTKMDVPFAADLWAVQDFWGLAPNDVYNVVHSHAVGEYSLVMHYDGIEWTEVWRLEGTSLYAIWGVDEANIFVAGLAGVIHFDGQTWDVISSGKWFYDLAGVVH